MEKTDQALRTLQRMRDQLVDRFAEALSNSKDADSATLTQANDPLLCDPLLRELATGLARLNNVISAFQGTQRKQGTSTRRVPVASAAVGQLFETFVDRVNNDRVEEASRELVTILRLPLNRAITATRFFERAVRQDPAIVRQLDQLLDAIDTTPDANCMRTLVAAFGLQAVESNTAIAVMRDWKRGQRTPTAATTRKEKVAGPR